MKIRIELAEGLPEPEVIIRCAELDDTVRSIQKAVQEVSSGAPRLIFYREHEEHYFSPEEVLFFETAGDGVFAHTAADVFRVRFRLYELERFLPRHFLRVSKSTVLNLHHILSISRDLSAASLVQFRKSHKQVYVSRLYYKVLRQRLDERGIL